jgi:PAS domain S-box-containing protein
MQPRPFHDLRRRAETRVGPPTRESDALCSAPPDLLKLIHELQVHQVELEMQNEELRRANHETEEARKKYLDLFDSAPVGYVTLDVLGRIQEANLTLAEFLGRPRQELLGQPLRGYVAPEQRQSFVTFCRKVATAIAPQTCELQISGPQEKMLDVQVKGLPAPPVSDPLKLGRVGLVFVDITAQRQAEREQAALRHKLEETQKLESLGVLAGGIAHDFNNLLTAILGNACLIRSELAGDPKAGPGVERIIAAAGRAAELCKQMLDYSGKSRFIVEPVDLNRLIQDTTPLLKLSTSKNVLLTTHLAPQLPHIGADPTQMRQVLMNLIINASEAVGDRNGAVTISTGVRHADGTYLQELHPSFDLAEGRYVYLEVRDDGCGMSPETLARIFDPFFTTKFTGRGLGLAAVLGIVRAHRGAIKVTSQTGCGTIFTLIFPVLREDVSAPMLSVPSEPVVAEWRGHGTVLLMDDEEAVRSVARRMLEKLGFEVVLAADGQEGLDLFRPAPQSFAVVLLDLTMPHLNGPGTLREIRRIRPDTRVLLMSGFNEQNTAMPGELNGPSGFLQKPFKPDDLRKSLQDILQESTRCP